ncbi:PA0069 family radical SAM protein [Siccirubricoccus sp. KC 17139]|uniref:PA0069 family radical SAM protein n=1 Tax=Siccirubricoccus soli TaxID=2899147 RepID=A0ABT1D8E5_9PROT|nr:PA0069 family radical SAM protein [Siccirubricoccus soli]MCO6418188.1 PA0069 family radical SAM protein [Siccirubricoccus soli]MCP2684323.1 PA0069 family radical SAM protein [Siccirubricoccus soli]
MPDGLAVSPGLGLPRKGRGALSNPAVRYESTAREAFDDGWGSLAELAELPPLPTTLLREKSRSAMTWNESPDIGFDRSLNPYRGCEHGCVYCYARPSHAYVGYSPGLDFETRLLFKPDLPALLEKELRRPGYQAKPVALGANTDPYQPVERTLLLTRQVLEVLERFGHPVTIVTKSAGVLRDLDILRRMAARNLVHVCLSITTLDAALARKMEPRAAAPSRRLEAIRQLTAAGVPAGVLAAPMIPGLNDAELERILSACAAAGATRAGYVLLRLPMEIRQLFEEWARTHFPDRAARILALVRETRGGQLYDSRFGVRQSGTGNYADMLASRFRLAITKLGMNKTGVGAQGLDCSQFAPPPAAVPAARQLELL